MSNINYKKLFSEIRNSNFIKRCSTQNGILEMYYSTQEDMLKGKVTLVHCCDKNGRGKELLYAPDGKPILDVKLRCGLPHGRAKMYDKNGIFTGNTYWYYGQEVTSAWALGHFSKMYEDEERKLPQKDLRARDKIYETSDFNLVLYGYAALEGIQKPNFKVLAKMRREKMR